MTALTDFTDQLAGWLNRADYDQTLLTSFVRMAEERLNEDLRVADMIKLDYATITKQRCPLPTDWLAVDFILDGDRCPLRYMPRDDIYAYPIGEATGYYTISGNYIAFGGEPNVINGNLVETAYYARIPQLSDEPTWLSVKYPSLYLWAALVSASAYGVEDERAVGWETSMMAKIDRLNKAHLVAKASGSRVSKVSNRGFG